MRQETSRLPERRREGRVERQGTDVCSMHDAERLEEEAGEAVMCLLDDMTDVIRRHIEDRREQGEWMQ